MIYNKMKYLTWDIKISFIGVIIIAVAIVVFVSVFSYYKFGDINKEYSGVTGELVNIKDELTQTKNILDDTSTELVLKKEREEDLSVKYEELLAEKKGLEENYNELKEKNEDLDAQLLGLNKEVGTLNLQLIETKDLLNAKEQQITALYLRLDCYEVAFPNAVC